MKELWLKFTDTDGAVRRDRVDSDRFTIGRHSEIELCILDSRLSREHARIERSSDSYYLSDLNSSNGTKLNGRDVVESTALRNGDLVDLGGGVEIGIEIVEQTPATAAGPAHVSTAVAPQKPRSHANKAYPVWAFALPPLLALMLVTVAGGAVFMLTAKDSTEIVTNNDDDDPGDSNTNDKPPITPTVTSTPRPADTPPGNSNTSANSQTSAANLSDTAKVEQNGAAFLRKIAQNNPNAFLTTDQARKVDAKVKQIGGSSAVAENIASANKGAGQLKAIAAAKNLKPQFLAVAAITQLGSRRGDVVQTAQSMIDTLDKLGTQIGTELADDSLLIIAAYEQGAAGDTMKMRNMLQDLSNKFPQSSRTIRSIWFLQQQSKISPAEFDRALSFLAFGTIAQNPKDFGVNSEALSL